MAIAATNINLGNGTPPIPRPDTQPVPGTPSDPAKGAASRVAAYMEQLYGSDFNGWWNTTRLKEVAEKGTFYSDSLKKQVTVPKEIQDAAKTLVNEGTIFAIDKDNDDVLWKSEFLQYANSANEADIR